MIAILLRRENVCSRLPVTMIGLLFDFSFPNCVGQGSDSVNSSLLFGYRVKKVSRDSNNNNKKLVVGVVY